MTPSSATAAKSRPTLPDFSGMVGLRREWRVFHEKQDRENADRAFRDAGVDSVRAEDLGALPTDFQARLGEFGRDWERALAAQGLREGFSFYCTRLSIGIDEVNALHDWLEKSFVGKGAALFFESDGLRSLAGGVWDSVFFFTLRPGISPDAIGLATAPGVRAVENPTRIA
jgi:hypothetical protein